MLFLSIDWRIHSHNARALLDWNSLIHRSALLVTTTWVAPSQTSTCPRLFICKDWRFVGVSVDWLVHSCDARGVLLDWNSLTHRSALLVTTTWVAPSQTSTCLRSISCKDWWFVDVVSVDWLVHSCDARVLLDWNSLTHQSEFSITTNWVAPSQDSTCSRSLNCKD